MEGLMSNQVISLIGPPGSGKDTQAMRLCEEYEIVQVPSSQLILQYFAKHADDPVVQREKEGFDRGDLTDATLIGRLVMEFIRPLAAKGIGALLSGSPRRTPEAELEFVELPKLYGDRNVRVIHLELDEAEARRRIANRRLCRANNHPIPGTPEFAHLTVCPKDGSELYRRALDDADKQDRRFQEYYEKTVPCLAIAEKHGVAVFTVDGSKPIEAIHADIVGIVERHRSPVGPA
jgi:adenylate kinase